jgi:hypothetical protein
MGTMAERSNVVGGTRRRVAVLLDGTAAARRAVHHVLERAKRDPKLEVVLLGLEPALVQRLPAALARLVIPGRATAAGRTREARALLEMHGVPCRIAGASGRPAAAIAEALQTLCCDELVIAQHARAPALPAAIAARCARPIIVV